jgi:hypothetical protein
MGRKLPDEAAQLVRMPPEFHLPVDRNRNGLWMQLFVLACVKIQ